MKDFWPLIEQFQTGGTKSAQAEWLRRGLLCRTKTDVEDFYLWVAVRLKEINSYDMYGAFYNCFGIGSLDGFFEFQPWLITLGRDVFISVASNPDNLIDIPQVRFLLHLLESGRGWSFENSPAFGELDIVICDAYTMLEGDVKYLDDIVSLHGLNASIFELEGHQWDIDDQNQVRVRLPKIYRYKYQENT
ncbi:DUF4240 domain-containing protein [Nonomuraea sp. MCN248]|uniref:DUF4240 domain-containing protein n=1 Tax=Nonomuraea corallina TaxID=2989783 RepID=A0ABT4SJI4_9ACTN|nr:DUF4240 domain-containing protein [Nonomuraea corallina]MDA0637270.1 DUF4240 domain-containing protein [Nonomuraea corallina]